MAQHKEYRKILLVDGDVEIQRLVKEVLSEYKIIISSDGLDGLTKARSESPELVLLELMLPKVNGFDICGLLRRNEATRHIPVIGITASWDFKVHLEAFREGADDVLQKPIRAEDLLARVNSKFLRVDESKKVATILKAADLELHIDRLEYRVRGELVTLSVLEFNLLRFFVENINYVLSRQRILQAVWPEGGVTVRTVDTHMTSLRKKVGNSGVEFLTLYGAGYILKEKIGEVSGANEGETPVATERPFEFVQ
jgi:two-component system, OmpR family, alkaline phosphatase synthesis response regulator PhoP